MPSCDIAQPKAGFPGDSNSYSKCSPVPLSISVAETAVTLIFADPSMQMMPIGLRNCFVLSSQHPYYVHIR